MALGGNEKGGLRGEQGVKKRQRIDLKAEEEAQTTDKRLTRDAAVALKRVQADDDTDDMGLMTNKQRERLLGCRLN